MRRKTPSLRVVYWTCVEEVTGTRNTLSRVFLPVHPVNDTGHGMGDVHTSPIPFSDLHCARLVLNISP